jgi:glycerol-3-phosphate dehydrogenase (NAD(P)+)
VLAQSAMALGVEMPIVAAVCSLLEGKASVGEVVQSLMTRPLRVESW